MDAASDLQCGFTDKARAALKQCSPVTAVEVAGRVHEICRSGSAQWFLKDRSKRESNSVMFHAAAAKKLQLNIISCCLWFLWLRDDVS